MELISVKKNDILQYYTHKCESIDETVIGTEVVVFGWLRAKRDLGSILFFEINDGTESVQVVTDNSLSVNQISSLGLESVLQIKGQLIEREENTINKLMKTGCLEIVLSDFRIFSKSKPLPFPVNSNENIRDEVLYEYRFLDLRREKTKDILFQRDRVFQNTREFFHEEGFVEIQTPLLGASSPEGAKDFLVFANNFPGQFFCLPQAPQIYKQLLVNSGFSKYFQIAPCFRSEASRGDRLPGAFYQCDLEIGFGTRFMVIDLMTNFIIKLFSRFAPHKTIMEVQHLTYEQSMEAYCSDKPDLRNPLKVVNVTSLFLNTECRIFRQKIDQGAKLFAIHLVSQKSSSYFNSIVEWAEKEFKRKIGYAICKNGSWQGPLGQFMPEELDKNEYGVFFYCDYEKQDTRMFLNKLRIKLGEDLVDKNKVALCFITEFPMFEYDEEKKSWDFMHNPFCRPLCSEEDLRKKQNLESVLSAQYDLVCNGYELGSGSERNASNEIMDLVFQCVGKSGDYYRENFKAMYKAFSYGVIPHAGMAIGLERTMMLIFDFDNVRFLEAFPCNQSGRDLMTQAPLDLTEEQKKDVKSHLISVFPELKNLKSPEKN